MTNWENQVRENSLAIQKMLTDAVSLQNIPTATSFLGTDWAIIWNNTSNRLEKVSVSNLLNNFGWIRISDYYMSKVGGNINTSLLEVGDEVYFRKITNSGDPLTLLGLTYNGGDEQLLSSYSQNQAITT